MKTTQIIGMVLIALSLYLGYSGINKVSKNTAEVKVLGLKIDASDESGKNEGYIYIGFALISLVGGISLLNKK
jgi:hypothetical protein